jgi:ABC-type multidrug transport system fused ATPase/permease subunit
VGEEKGFFDRLPLMDKNKATKFIVYGLVAAVLFGLIMMISRSVAQNAATWENLENQRNEINYWNGEYGFNDFIKRQEEIDEIRYWMEWQDVIFMNIARVGVNISLIFMVIGFLSFAVNDKLDEGTRKISLIIAGLILFVIMFTTFFSAIAITVA